MSSRIFVLRTYSSRQWPAESHVVNADGYAACLCVPFNRDVVLCTRFFFCHLHRFFLFLSFASILNLPFNGGKSGGVNGESARQRRNTEGKTAYQRSLYDDMCSKIRGNTTSRILHYKKLTTKQNRERSLCLRLPSSVPLKPTADLSRPGISGLADRAGLADGIRFARHPGLLTATQYIISRSRWWVGKGPEINGQTLPESLSYSSSYGIRGDKRQHQGD